MKYENIFYLLKNWHCSTKISWYKSELSANKLPETTLNSEEKSLGDE